MRRPHSTNQPKLSLDGKYSNRNLFADHFLTDRLGEATDWQPTDGPQSASAPILGLYLTLGLHLANATNDRQARRGSIRRAPLVS